MRSPNSYRVSNSTGGLPWQAPCNRRLLYQSTYAAVATSTSLILCHGPRGLINSVLYKYRRAMAIRFTTWNQVVDLSPPPDPGPSRRHILGQKSPFTPSPRRPDSAPSNMFTRWMADAVRHGDLTPRQRPR